MFNEAENINLLKEPLDQSRSANAANHFHSMLQVRCNLKMHGLEKRHNEHELDAL